MDCVDFTLHDSADLFQPGIRQETLCAHGAGARRTAGHIARGRVMHLGNAGGERRRTGEKTGRGARLQRTAAATHGTGANIYGAGADGAHQVLLDTFGMIPCARIPKGAKPFDTMNAKSETVGEKRSFSGAWKQYHLYLVPTISFFEPNDKSEPKSGRQCIWLKAEPGFAVAGL